jgi:cyclopropane-fatty-acyl-phospholipid synthase
MLKEILRRSIRQGSLTLIDPSGRVTTFGEKRADKKEIVVRLVGTMTPLKLALWPDLYLGEAYMNGSLVLERGDLWDLLDLCGRNQMEGSHSKSGYPGRLSKVLLRRLRQRNALLAARSNVAHHYDHSHACSRVSRSGSAIFVRLFCCVWNAPSRQRRRLARFPR